MKLILTENQFKNLIKNITEDTTGENPKYQNLGKFFDFLANPVGNLLDKVTPYGAEKLGSALGIPSNKEDVAADSNLPNFSSVADFTNPLGDSKYRITSQFNEPRDGYLHGGIDIAAPVGTPIYSPSDGRVLMARNSVGKCGGYVQLDHGNINTRYCHLSKWDVLKPNDVVKKGQLIGYVGNTGKATGPHLHYEIRDKNNIALNPLNFRGWS